MFWIETTTATFVFFLTGLAFQSYCRLGNNFQKQKLLDLQSRFHVVVCASCCQTTGVKAPKIDRNGRLKTLFFRIFNYQNIDVVLRADTG